MYTKKKKNIFSGLAIAAAILTLAGCSANTESEYDYSYDYSVVTSVESTVNSTVESTSAVTETVESTSADTETTETVTENSEDDVEYGYTASGLRYRKLHLKYTGDAEDNDTSNSSSETTSTPATSTSAPATSTSAPTTSTSAPVTSTSAPSVDFNSAAAIKTVCGRKSKVETDVAACLVDTINSSNPYDLIYDYGSDYDKYVNACDWNLVFDADEYIANFPLLAMQYHYDKALLLKHFQTIGIHEGRQGSKNFNVAVYMDNCSSDIKNAFGNNYEGYYFYYMLNQNTEKSVETKANSSSKIQQKTIMTAVQAEELKGVNAYRAEVGVAAIEFNSELASFANYRAYLNGHDGYRAHDWAKANTDKLFDAAALFGSNHISENTATVLCDHNYNCRDYECNYAETNYNYYRTSEAHYNAMVNAKFDLIGLSNCYKGNGAVSHFQIFINL